MTLTQEESKRRVTACGTPRGESGHHPFHSEPTRPTFPNGEQRLISPEWQNKRGRLSRVLFNQFVSTRRFVAYHPAFPTRYALENRSAFLRSSASLPALPENPRETQQTSSP